MAASLPLGVQMDPAAPDPAPLRTWRPYLLVVLHIVAQTDQTGLELLRLQAPTVILRSARQPSERRIMRMNGERGMDGGMMRWTMDGWTMEG